MKPGASAHVTAHGLTLAGEGVASLEGRELLCPGLFASEQAEVRIEAVSKQHPVAHASLLRLLSPHPQRRPAPCPNHVARGGSCNGCALMELEESAQRALKREMLRTRFGLEVAEISAAPEAFGYRFSSKRVVHGARGGVFLGSFARRSHSPANMDGCLVDHPLLVRAFAAVAEAANRLDIEPYDERSRRGDLRYVWGKTNGRELIVTLITGHCESRARTLLPAVLGDELGIDGVAWGMQGDASNALRGTAAELVRGRAELTTTLLGQNVEVGALGFLQPNPVVAEQAYAALTSADEPHEARALAFDLYAGAGVTTRRLREQFAEVVPSEAYPESATALGVEAQTVEAFLEAELTRIPVRKPQLVIANPPRKGMGEKVCSLLCTLGAPALHIMSCGPEGLARDLKQLSVGERGYELVALSAFDTLPQTPHIELVAKLRLR